MLRLCLAVCAFLPMALGSARADDVWTLSFQDDFERAAVGPEWRETEGVSIVNGRLRLVGIVNALLTRTFPGDVRVTFDAWAIDGILPCDISVTLCGGPEVGWGYLLGFGARLNRANHLLGPGVDFVDTKPPFVIEHGKQYHCVAVKEGKRITYEVNGVTLIDETTEDPLRGPGFDLVGVITWTGMELDNFRVYERAAPHPDTPRKIERIPDGPLYRDQRKLHIRKGAATPELEAAVKSFNAGRLDEALAQFRALGPTLPGLLGQAYVLGDLAYVEPFFNDAFVELAGAFAAAAAAAPDDAVLADYAEMAEWFGRFKMRRDGRAAVAAGRFVRLGPDNNPFYYKARLYQARYHYWNGAESGDGNAMTEAVAWMDELKRLWPENSVLRQYTGEQIPWGEEFTADTERHPAWAAYLREAYARSVAYMEHFIDQRQDEDGEFGGGAGDDVEMMRTWMQIAAISSGAEKARRGIERLAERIWDAVLEDGFADHLSDVEHAAEPSADMLPGMLLMRPGDPLWVERNMASCKTIKDLYMGIDALGYPRFRASVFGGGEIEETILGGGDSGYCARAMKHYLWEAWRGNPDAVDWFVRWADGWRDLTMREIDGKLPGVVPLNVWYPDASITPPQQGATWWDDKLNYWPRPDLIVDVFLAAYALTGDDKFLQPYRLGMEYGSLGPIRRPEHPPGSPQWQITTMLGYSSNMPTEQCRPALYRWLTGDRVYDDFVMAYGDPTQWYQVNGDLNAYLRSFEGAANSLRYNLELATTEVLSTDRCGLPSALSIFGAYTGAQTGMRDACTPTFAVTYNTPSTDFAALVVFASTRRLRIWFYNFDEQPMPIDLMPWRLEPGRYVLNQGEQVLGEKHTIKRYAWEPSQSLELLRRGEGPVIHVPPATVWCVDLRLEEPREVPKFSPDLAVHARDVARSEDGLAVTVHNIGFADSQLVPIEVQTRGADGDWTVAARGVCPALAWPRGFVPSETVVQLPVDLAALRDEVRVVVDPGQSQFDANLRNNIAPVRL